LARRIRNQKSQENAGIPWHASKTAPGVDLENFLAALAVANLASAGFNPVGIIGTQGLMAERSRAAEAET
jgi:hypothetical protein